MKKIQLYFLAAACCLFVLQSCTKEDVTITEDNSAVEDALRKGNAPAASGQGTIEWAGIDGKRHFSFHAKTKSDGTVTGSGVLTYTKGDLKVKFSIDCISVTGNVAVLSGSITSHSGNPTFVGSDCRFAVMDNGEGSKADPDRMTPLYTYPGIVGVIDCNITYPDTAFSEVLEGNVQVSE